MARPNATDQVQRMLAIIPWIVSHGEDGVRVADVCARFDLSQKELLTDLQLMPFVGLPPYTPDQLVEVDIDGEFVRVRLADFFRRPLRLTRSEGLALLAAATAASTTPGHDPEGPLARGIAKLRDLLGVHEGHVQVELGQASDATLEALGRAVHDRRVVRLRYFSPNSGQRSERDVEPQRLFATDGAWYLGAHCRHAADHRIFRVDRIATCAVLDERFTPRESEADTGSDTTFSPGPDTPLVTLDVPGSASWLRESYPLEGYEERPDGRLRVTLAVAAPGFLARLLLRLGTSATVVDAPAELRDVAAGAAGAVLERYVRPAGGAGTAAGPAAGAGTLQRL